MNVFMLLDMLADTDPDRVIVGDRTEGLTYAALRDEARRAASRLQADGGRPVVYVTVASEAYPVALFGAALAGTPFVPVSYRLATGPLGAILEEQSPAVLVAEAPREPVDRRRMHIQCLSKLSDVTSFM